MLCIISLFSAVGNVSKYAFASARRIRVWYWRNSVSMCNVYSCFTVSLLLCYFCKHYYDAVDVRLGIYPSLLHTLSLHFAISFDKWYTFNIDLRWIKWKMKSMQLLVRVLVWVVNRTGNKNKKKEKRHHRPNVLFHEKFKHKHQHRHNAKLFEDYVYRFSFFSSSSSSFVVIIRRFFSLRLFCHGKQCVSVNKYGLVSFGKTEQLGSCWIEIRVNIIRKMSNIKCITFCCLLTF